MKKRFLSLIIALAMMVGVFTPLLTSAEGADHKTDVVVHKIELKDLTGWPKKAGEEGADKSKYDGSKLGLGYFGTDAKELANVKFTYWTVSKEQYDELTKNSSAYDTKDKVLKKYPELGKGTEIQTKEEEKEGKKEVIGAKAEGLVNGYYWFVEDKDSVSRDGRTFSGAAAVPFGLALPYAKANGKPFGQGADALHVYPKNTLADKPLVDKDFQNPGANPEKPRSAEEKNKPEAHNVGDKIPYEIKTIFQPNSKYQTAFWTDQMTEGLKFNQDSLTVTIGGKEIKNTEETKYYSVDTTVNNFKVVLEEAGLKLVNEQANKTEVSIKYTATLTKEAEVDVPESNDVIFHYGNNPSKGNTPVPNKPDNGKITFTKSWDGEVPKGASITVTLYNANTGAQVGDSKKLTATELTAEWTGLDKDTEYKVVETAINGYDAEYTKGKGLGVLGAKNWKTNNPAPLNPDEPKVVTYGKKFVKMEKNTDIRLKDAEFVVKNAEGKYLQPAAKADRTAFEAAQKAYSDAVVAYNKLSADKQTKEEKDKVQKLADERDKAWREYLSDLSQWGDKGTALKLKSDEAGAFEIRGLKDGTYYLEETKAPAGYADIKDPIKFTVGKGSYTTGDINYNTLEAKKDAQRVDNTKLTIPQTGGIGTIIFTAIGLAIMASAIIAIKKRQATEAR
ncbi:MAG: pilin N-terminal domain-containing protein [Finegoldia magna]|nr:pilin N-terminal domain-containing protein [Finegoldia magna]